MQRLKFINQKNMKVICIMMLFLVFLKPALFSTTTQQPDILIYKGVRYNIHSNILSSFFWQHPERRPTSKGIITSYNWRGYTTTYEIAENELWIINLDMGLEYECVCDFPIVERAAPEVIEKNERYVVYSTIVIDKINICTCYESAVSKNYVPDVFNGRDRAKAYWYTGRLTATRGNMMRWGSACNTINSGTPHYENYLLIDIANGNFVREMRLTSEEYILYIQRLRNPSGN